VICIEEDTAVIL